MWDVAGYHRQITTCPPHPNATDDTARRTGRSTVGSADRAGSRTTHVGLDSVKPRV